MSPDSPALVQCAAPPVPAGVPAGVLARAQAAESAAARTARALEIAREAGFDAAGVVPLAPSRRVGAFEAWLARGYHAGMGWLAEGLERVRDPRRLLPGGRSLLVLGWSHARAPVALRGGGRVARYAAGRDYHNVLGTRLRRLARRLRQAGLAGDWRKAVDAAPLLERAHAAEAGLGFESKSANLLHPRHGPWMFLAELAIDRELEPSASPAPGSCGTCRACIDACPTRAIVEPGVVDANRCLSYHTIENHVDFGEPTAVPDAVRERWGSWVFGCDVCSEVCPVGTRAEPQGERLGVHAAIADGTLADWLRLSAREFEQRFAGSPLARARREGLARSAALALAAVPGDAARGALVAALEHDPAPAVREAAAWSLARLGHDAPSRAALERAAARESDARWSAALRGRLEPR